MSYERNEELEKLNKEVYGTIQNTIFANEANVDGAIIVTFGLVMKNITTEAVHKFLKAFSYVSYNVLWAYAGDNIPLEVSQNVKLVKWLPQNDVLGHANTRLFIAHCETSGQYESLHHGIPMIGFPLFADQHHNALCMEDKQFGLKMDINTFTSEELVQAIQTVIGADTSGSVYVQNAKIASEKLKSRPLNAQQKAVYWVEYVLKYGGKDLRSHAMDMSLPEFLMLDLLVSYLMF